MTENSLIKQRFVGQVLREQGQEMLRRQEDVIRKKTKFRSGTLLASRILSISDGNGYMDGRLSFRHVAYERFLDIKKKVGASRGGYKTRNLRIHNRFIMGGYYAIAKHLMYGLTQEVRDNLKKDMQMTIPF